MFVIIAVVAHVAVAHPQLFYPTAFSYQNNFVRNIPQPFMAAENEGMDRFTSAQFFKQTKSPYREYKGEYRPVTAQRYPDHVNRDLIENFE